MKYKSRICKWSYYWHRNCIKVIRDLIFLSSHNVRVNCLSNLTSFACILKIRVVMLECFMCGMKVACVMKRVLPLYNFKYYRIQCCNLKMLVFGLYNVERTVKLKCNPARRKNPSLKHVLNYSPILCNPPMQVVLLGSTVELFPWRGLTLGTLARFGA